MKQFPLKDSVVLITGASSGIGEASARIFAQKGSHLVLAARRMDRLTILSDELRALGVNVIPVCADVSRQEDIDGIVRQASSKFGRVDILFNNAGFGRVDFLDKLDTEKDIIPQIQVNLLGVIAMTRAILPLMMKQRRGHIINMSSMAGWVATPTYSVYAASKFAIRGFSEGLRREVAPWGIAVSTMYPHSVITEFGEHAGIHRKTGSFLAGKMAMSASYVAGQVVRTAHYPKSQVILPSVANVAVWMNQLFPTFVDWITIRKFTLLERKNELLGGAAR